MTSYCFIFDNERLIRAIWTEWGLERLWWIKEQT